MSSLFDGIREVEELEQGGLFEAELLEVAVFIVRGTSLPAAEKDSEPFEGQGTHGGVVAQAAAAEHPVVSFRPERPLARMVGVLMECLPQELGAGATAADRARLAAADLHGRDAAYDCAAVAAGREICP